MLGSNWRKDLEFGLIVVACVLILALPISGLMLSEYADVHRANATYQQNAEKDRNAASEEISKSCFNFDFPIFSKCITEKIATYYKQQATNQDLQAQQDMAYWAKTLFFLGVLQFLLSSAGIYFIWRSLALNRDAVNAAVNANANALKAMKAELRPWIKFIDIHPRHVILDGNGLSIVLKCIYKNVGRSPATNVYVSGSIHYTGTKVVPWDYLREKAGALPKEISVLVNTIFPDDDPTENIEFKWHSPTDGRSSYVYVFVSVSYSFDDFPEVHKTCRLYQLATRLRPGSQPELHKLDFRAAIVSPPAIFFERANTGDYAD